MLATSSKVVLYPVMYRVTRVVVRAGRKSLELFRHKTAYLAAILRPVRYVQAVRPRARTPLYSKYDRKSAS